MTQEITKEFSSKLNSSKASPIDNDLINTLSNYLQANKNKDQNSFNHSSAPNFQNSNNYHFDLNGKLLITSHHYFPKIYKDSNSKLEDEKQEKLLSNFYAFNTSTNTSPNSSRNKIIGELREFSNTSNISDISPISVSNEFIEKSSINCSSIKVKKDNFYSDTEYASKNGSGNIIDNAKCVNREKVIKVSTLINLNLIKSKIFSHAQNLIQEIMS